MVEGILAGGSGGLAVHAALRGRRARSHDPEALVAVILPDGGRSYLSKVYNDAWMTQHGFLERPTDQTVGDVLYAKQEAGEIPPLVTVQTHQKVRDASRCCTSTASRSCPSSARTTRRRSSARSASAACSSTRSTTPRCSTPRSSTSWRRRSRPCPSGDPVREAVALLVGDRQALMVTEQGRATGILTRADLLEALAR